MNYEEDKDKDKDKLDLIQSKPFSESVLEETMNGESSSTPCVDEFKVKFMICCFTFMFNIFVISLILFMVIFTLFFLFPSHLLIHQKVKQNC